MKKSLKIFLIVIAVLIGVILLDTMQALVFNNNPVLSIKTKCESNRGLFVTTYHCGNGKNVTKWKSTSCNFENVCEIKIEDLERIHEEIDKKLEEYEKVNGKKYTNVSSTGVDQNLKKVVITLVDNSEEEQKLFREVIYDSEYIMFEQGGPYTTSSELSLLVKSNTLTAKGATFVLKNNTDIDYDYDPAYYIEKKENSIWREIILKEPLSWNSVLYTLKAGEETDIIIDWVLGYGELKNGEYRLIKNNFRKKNNPDSKSYSVYAEFTIGETSSKKIEIVKPTIQNSNKLNVYLERDNRVIYMSSSIEEVYINGDNKQTLKNYISNAFQTTDDGMKSITDFMINTETLKDGGTKIYKSKEYDLTIVKCNTLLGNYNYFIGDYNMNYDNDLMCKN